MKWLIMYLMAGLIFLTACSDSGNNTADQKKPTDSRIKEMIRYNQMGQPFLKVRYDYDSRGLLQREVYWDSSSVGIRTREKVYFYEDTLKTRMEMRTENGISYTGLFEYDDQDRLTLEEFMDSSVFRWISYVYNEYDKITEQTTWEQGGRYRKLKYSYKDPERIDTVFSLDTAGKVLQKDIYTYQTENDTLLDQLMMYDAAGNSLAQWQYNYNDRAQLVEEVEIASDGSQFVLKQYVYNPQGEVIQEKSFKYQFYTRRFDYDDSGTILMQERYFDKMGNMNYRNIYEPIPASLD